MTSEAIRDPLADPLLTSQNSALVVIDYRSNQVQTVSSIDHDLLVRPSSRSPAWPRLSTFRSSCPPLASSSTIHQPVSTRSVGLRLRRIASASSGSPKRECNQSADGSSIGGRSC